MWIVSLALRRPYTFVVVAMLIMVIGVFEVLQMPTDILPEIDIPVVAVVWTYNGLPPGEMEQRFTSLFERSLTTTVNGIEHIDSQSLYGIAVVKVFFQPGTKIEMGNAQITAISQTLLKQFPVGATPPQIINYSASNVPILQGSVHSETMPEQELFDLSSNFLRVGMATVQGAQLPTPYGGKQRQVMVDIDLPRLYALGLSPEDVNLAVQAQNLVLPSGTAKIGDQELLFRPNGSPDAVSQIAALPLKTAHGATVLLKDVATVRDGFAPQTSLVRANGRRGVLVTHPEERRRLHARHRHPGQEGHAAPHRHACRPRSSSTSSSISRSSCARPSSGVVKEAGIAAGLTALMILLFLGSWRSTLIVITSIPLSILVSLIILALPRADAEPDDARRGLSLAVGILVDDATVELENVHRNLGMKKPIVTAILDGAQQIAVPALVATLCICIVFIPVAFISGAARSLFTPLGMAVVFAMMMSYFLSRTLVPTMVHTSSARRHICTTAAGRARRSSYFRIHERFNVHFERLRRRYGGYLDVARSQKKLVTGGFGVFVALSLGLLFPHLGQDFFPSVDAGQIRLHVRANPGTRIEDHRAPDRAQVEDEIKAVVPKGRAHHGHRQHRAPGERHQPGARRPVDDLVRRRRDAGAAEARSTTRPRGTSRSCASASPSTCRPPRSSSSRPTSRPRCSTSGSRRPSTSRWSALSPTTRTRATGWQPHPGDQLAKVPGAVDVHLAQVA